MTRKSHNTLSGEEVGLHELSEKERADARGLTISEYMVKRGVRIELPKDRQDIKDGLIQLRNHYQRIWSEAIKKQLTMVGSIEDEWKEIFIIQMVDNLVTNGYVEEQNIITQKINIEGISFFPDKLAKDIRDRAIAAAVEEINKVFGISGGNQKQTTVH